LVTDENGNTVSRHDYIPFGEEIQANSGGRDSTFGTQDFVNQKFTGKERDQETGLDYFGARYFSGAQGRFTSPDPITTLKLEDPQRWNKYAYGRGNPLRFIDPTGLYNTDCKSKDITQCSAEIQAFEARRQRDLKSEDKRVRRAARAYGSFNDGNNVQLKFDPNATQGTARQDVDGRGRPKDSFTITLPTAEAASSLVAHEGSHLADQIDAMNGAKALTLLKSEILAYQTQAATMLDDPARFNVGHQMNFGNSMTLYVPWSDLIDDVNTESIKAFLAVNPAYKATQQKNEGGPVYVKPAKK